MPRRTTDSPIHPGDSLPHNVKLLGWASFLNDIASEMIYPLMPQFLIGVLGGSRFHLGIIEGVADSVASLLKLWSGARSDRVGRRKSFVVFGYALATVARPVLGLVVAPWQFFVTRVVDRIGKGIRTSPRDAMIADAADASIRGRAFGFHRAMDHLGAAIGPLFAMAFLWFWPGQLRTMFLVTIVPGLCVMGLLVLGLSERRVKGGGEPGVPALNPQLSTLDSQLSTLDSPPALLRLSSGSQLLRCQLRPLSTGVGRFHFGKLQRCLSSGKGLSCWVDDVCHCLLGFL